MCEYPCLLLTSRTLAHCRMSPCLVVSDAGLESSSMQTREPYAPSTQPMVEIDSINSFMCPMSIPKPPLFPSYTPMSEHFRTQGYKRCSFARYSMMALLEAIRGPSSNLVIASFWLAFMALQANKEENVFLYKKKHSFNNALDVA